MKKIIIFLLFSICGYAQLSPALSNVYFETSILDGSNKGVSSDALFDAVVDPLKIQQLRGSYGGGGESVDNLITHGIWLLSTSSTGTKPAFTTRNIEVTKSAYNATFITQTAHHITSGRTASRNSTDTGATWSVWQEYAGVDSPTFTTNITTPAVIVSSETASTIASFDASKNIKSLSTGTYPSLTELSYVKGLPSPIDATYVKIVDRTFRTLANSYIDVSNTITSQETLFSYVIPINTLSSNGDKLEIVINSNTTVANVQGLIELGGNNIFGYTQIGTGPSLYKFTIYRVNSTTIRVIRESDQSVLNYTVANLSTNTNTINYKYTAALIGGQTLRETRIELKKGV